MTDKKQTINLNVDAKSPFPDLNKFIYAYEYPDSNRVFVITVKNNKYWLILFESELNKILNIWSIDEPHELNLKYLIKQVRTYKDHLDKDVHSVLPDWEYWSGCRPSPLRYELSDNIFWEEVKRFIKKME